MLKMSLDMMGQVTLTNDGNAILREIDVQHPVAKTILDLARVQDEQVGDGTTSVIVLAGEMLAAAEPFLRNNYHPTKIVNAFFMALEDAMEALNGYARAVDPADSATIENLVKTCIGTKFTYASSDLLCRLSMEAVDRVVVVREDGTKDIDVKRYVRIEKIPGGDLSDSVVLDGVILNKDVLHPKMPRRIENPRIILLDCPLEYEKAESALDVHLMEESDFARVMQIEEEYVEGLCRDILALRPSLVITEKGCSDYAQHLFRQQNVAVLRRLRITDSNRIARAVGANIVHRPEDLKEEDVGTGCGLFEVRKIGDEYFSYMVECKNPKACSLVLRGGSKDVLNEIVRNLKDAMSIVRNCYLDPRIVSGGGSVEMSLAAHLMEKSQQIMGVEQLPYQALACAFEVIPRTLAENAGAKTIRLVTELRAKHAKGRGLTWGIDGRKGVLADMETLQIFEPFVVKSQSIKTAVEAVCMVLRIDDIVSGIPYHEEVKSGPVEQPDPDQSVD